MRAAVRIQEVRVETNMIGRDHMPDCPFYFGNTIAVDFLKLRDNEWKAPHNLHDLCLDKDFAVLSVGCGDLRSVVNTVAQLPKEFRGKLSMTMCDFDPFVMARNVLFLYMMVKYADKPDFGKTLASIWYSVLLSEKDYNILANALKDLCDDKSKSLLEITGGLVDMDKKEVAVLKQVWSVWHGMECRHGKPGSINLTQQRLEQLKARLGVANGKVTPNPQIPPIHKESHVRWQRDGIIEEAGTNDKQLTHYNPTLTGRGGDYKGGSQPKDLVFGYCIQGDNEPFQSWDYIEIEKHAATGSHDDLPAMFHAYVAHIITCAVDFIGEERRVTLKMTISNCETLSSGSIGFDRVFTSNVADYVGFYRLAGIFGPMLNQDNPHSVLVMETLYGFTDMWEMMVDETELGIKKLNWNMAAYTDKTMNQRQHEPHPGDFVYDAKWFIRVLKSLYCLSRYNKELKVPSSKKVLRLGDLLMRDPRRELNKVIPYYNQKGPRGGAYTTNRLRVLEWYFLPDEE